MDESLLIAVERAMRSFGNSDASAVSELWSTTEDVTIFGAFGGHERGWDAVRPRLAWAASQFRDGTWSYELLAAHFGADVGYTVWIEHTQARIDGADAIHDLDLRVTHVFRRVDGDWRMVHRHADLLAKKAKPVGAVEPVEQGSAPGSGGPGGPGGP